MDPIDEWGKIPSQLLDRGSCFTSPDPSEEGLLVDEEYDLENIWDLDSQQDKNVQEDSIGIVPSLVFEEIEPQVSLEEIWNGNACQISGSDKEKLNLGKKSVKIKVKFIDVGDCELKDLKRTRRKSQRIHHKKKQE